MTPSAPSVAAREPANNAARDAVRRAALALALALPFACAAGEPAAAGEVVFVIGAARIVDVSGSSRPAEGGARIRPGDRIETAAGQHVHLRFVDGAFLSVRPGSRLTVERYDTEGDATAIRFNLDHGVVRSITGEAAQLRKDRFRLNTPLAAIGVRGTDFVVQADAAGLRAVVNQGAIVVAPFGSGCAAQALGPCATGEARELAASMGRVLLELTALQPARVVPLNAVSPDLAVPPARQEPTAAAPLVVAVETAGAGAAGVAPPPAPEAPVTPPPVIAPPAPVPVPVVPVAPSRLQWGRWAAPVRDGDTLSATYAEASDQRGITVANGYAGLFRSPGASPVLSTQLGRADFALAGAQVSLVNAAGVTPGSVNGGWLKIDFATRSFATGLVLSHPQTGAVRLDSAGIMRDDGIFAVNQGGTRVAGAVAMDGSEAGYLFDKSVPQGTLTGLTLWKR